MTAVTHPPVPTQPAQRVRRPAAVAAVIAAALVMWAIATQAAGVSLRSPAFSATQKPAAVGAGLVVAAAALAALAAWALLAILERTTRHPRRAWITVVIGALVVSLGAPLSGHGISGTDRAVLVCLHLIVASTVILLLGRTRPATPAARNDKAAVSHAESR
jgi:hypothetical protein